MRLKSIYAVFFVIFILLILIRSIDVFAQTPTVTPSPTQNPTPTPDSSSADSNICTSVPECLEQKLDCSKCIEYLTNKKNDLSGKAKTLSSEIGVMNNQIKLTEARIKATEQKIKELQKDIGIAKGKIKELESTIDRATRLLVERISAVYQVGRLEPWQIFLTARNIDDVFSRLKYLRIVQIYDKRKVYAAEQAKTDYANQKEIFEGKEGEAQALSKKLESYTSQLGGEKKAKDVLLTVTRNDESRYQRLLAQAQAERAIVFGGGKDVFMRNVNRGDSIGTIASHGASPGCSSGAHLHFEVHKDGSVQDPNNYLERTSFQYPSNYNADLYRTIDPRGDLPWPINAPIQINQGFGAQPNSSFYGPSGHQGIDMDSLSSSTVKAVKTGKLYGGSFQCVGYYPGPLYYAKVEHDDGTIAWFLHMFAL